MFFALHERIGELIIGFLSKFGLAGFVTLVCEDEDGDYLYGDFNMDEVDLNLENYEELFGVATSHI